MKQHPSGRPVRVVERRDYAMGGAPRGHAVLPRLRDDRPHHDTYAVGFLADWPRRDDLYLETEAKR